MIKRLVVAWLALVALAMPVSAQTFPPLTGRVVDNAHLLTASQSVDLNSKLAALEAGTGRQMVVATIPSLEGRTIEDYGYRLGRTWAIGQKGKDDGVILLVAPNEKKVRIETGYGARVFVTDAISGLIVQQTILPKFREGDMGGGIVAGADQLIQFMSLPAAEMQKRAAQAEQQRTKSNQGVPLMPILFWIIIILFVIMPLVRRAGGRRYRRGGPPVILWGPGLGGGGGGGWGGGGGGGWGGGGGGGFSGGGGSFGGGGASGGW